MTNMLPVCCECDLPFVPDNEQQVIPEMREQGWRIKEVPSGGPYPYPRWKTVCPAHVGNEDW